VGDGTAVEAAHLPEGEVTGGLKQFGKVFEVFGECAVHVGSVGGQAAGTLVHFT
jgi:hypothetical protein